METVVDEKPLSFATSRIVIVAAFIASFSSLDRIGVNHRSLNSCCCWRTLQQRVKPVSSSTIRFLLMLLLLASWQVVCAQPIQSPQTQQPRRTPSSQNADPQQLFQLGEASLKSGDLDEAEHAFRGVIAINPQVAGAYANLGVIYMRRKQWQPALEMLQKAEDLAPQIAGIRLNIGLVYYRQNDFRNAIAPFESVVKDAPNSFQARYLLGLCSLFVERYGDADST